MTPAAMDQMGVDTPSAIKERRTEFRDHVRSKTDTAMINEVLCKIICHNICCLIQETHELGITANLSTATHLSQGVSAA